MAITEADVIEYLNGLEWPVSPKMFNALFAASPSTAFELVVFVPEDEGLKVILLPRPEDDTEFPGMLHVPGTVMRRGDTKQSALERLRKEFLGVEMTEPEFVDVLDFPMGTGPAECSRGQEVARLYWARYLDGALPEGAVLAKPKALPLDKFGWPFQRILIEVALKAYHGENWIR